MWALAQVSSEPRVRSIERFMPEPDVRECHELLVHAPADVVMDVARGFDLDSIPLIRAIFWLRGKLMHSHAVPEAHPKGLAHRTRALGWGVLAEQPGREYVSGAVTQPWKGDVVFRAVPADQFAGFAEPGLVKIVWTLEAVPIERSLTLFRSETRVLATDSYARNRFVRYWSFARFGIVLIRRLAGPAIRREAERRHRHTLAAL